MGKNTKIDTKDDRVIGDAVDLLKSQFVSLYVKSGHDEEEAGLAWHKARISPTGHRLLSQKYKVSFPPTVIEERVVKEAAVEKKKRGRKPGSKNKK